MSITDKLVWVFLFVAILIFISFLKDSKHKNKRVVFFGDSITQAGAQPGGYISLLTNMLLQHGINNYDLIGSGIGGNKVYDLYLRMQADVIAQSPDIVVIWIGTNDVWHKATTGTGTDEDRFEKFYRAIIEALQINKISVMLVTPGVIGEKNNNSNQHDDELNKYSEIIKSIAKGSDLPLCDMRALFQLYEANHNFANADKGILTADGVHLNEAGNTFAADEIWKVLKNI